MWIQKTGMTVIARVLNILVESSHGGGGSGPSARLRSRRTIIKVVIDSDGKVIFIDLRFAKRDKAAGSRVDDVVCENIVRHVPLHLELTGACSRRIVVVERVVDYRAVLSVSPLRRVTPDRNTCGMAVVDKVISRSDVTGGAVLVLTGQLDSKVHIVNDVLFDQDSGAAVYVNTIGGFIVAVCRIAARSNVVNQIAAYYTVASLVDGRVGCRALKADDIDADVVVVVYDVVSNAEVRDIPVHYQRLAGSGFEVMHFIAVNDQVGDRGLGVGTVDGNAKSIATASWSIATFQSLLNMMNIVL